MRTLAAFAAIAAAALACNLPGRSPISPTEPQETTVPAATAVATASPTPTATLAPTSTPTPADVRGLPDPATARWELIASDFVRPLAVQSAGDDRLFVVEQRGMIWVVEGGDRAETPYLDLRDRVNSSAYEQGLLGLAFHPEFQSTGQFFVNYTDSGPDTVVSRFTADPSAAQADPGSEQVLLRFDQPYVNHNGGDLEFGPDGHLYISTGDGGSAGDPLNNGQSLDTLLGKILRIDVDSAEPYAIPPDNPFASGGGRPEIWDYGLRNPWRMSFDPATGDLYLGDVGQSSWEEVDIHPAGQPGGINFGWSHREGRHPYNSDRTEGLTDPIAEFSLAGGPCSVAGGDVVRDANLPEWRGVYLYGDYCTGQVWGLVRDESGAWQNERLFTTERLISAFGRDPTGAVYLVDHGGSLYKLVPSQ